MQRLSPLDASFLHLERDVHQLNVGSALVFDGPAPSHDEVCRAIESVLPIFPRYRQRIRRTPLDLVAPVWVDVPDFRVADHVEERPVPGSGTDKDLRELAVGLIAAPLDLTRPLWRSWLLTGLEGGRWALVNVDHHAMIDGISGTDIISALLQPTPDARPAPVEPWVPEPAPSSAALAVSGALALAAAPLRAVRAVARAVRPGAVTGTLSGAYGVARLGEQMARPEFGLTGALGAGRRWGWADADLDDVKAVKNAHGATVNDVVLAATASGFRRLLLARGQRVTERTVRTMVPVSMRESDEHGALGNRVSAVFTDLPVGVEDPVDRLHAVMAEMGSLKSGGTALGIDALMGAADLVPSALFALGTRAWGRLPQRSISTVVTNVPGPQVPLYLLGRRMRSDAPLRPARRGGPDRGRRDVVCRQARLGGHRGPRVRARPRGAVRRDQGRRRRAGGHLR